MGSTTAKQGGIDMKVKAPNVTADPCAVFEHYGEDGWVDEYEVQKKEARAWYEAFLPKVLALRFERPAHRLHPFCILSPDPEGGWRVSMFDDLGAVRHVTRPTKIELFDELPIDGRCLEVVLREESL